MLEHAYHAADGVLKVNRDGTLQGGMATLNLMEIFPPQWPLAMTLPLKSFVHPLDRLIAGYLMEVVATCSDPYQCRRNISTFAKVLTVRAATYFAELIASLLRPVLYHPNMIQLDDDTEPLLTSKFWVRPVYQELLHAASRLNLSPISNLVKVASHPKVRYQAAVNISALQAPISEWIGAECPVDYLNVWFPARWAPLVFQALQQKGEDYRAKNPMWFDAH